ncbi:MAG: AMMECR1 domain-containing protein [Sulfurimonadaceae bacterium]|jgi:AMMECR1 domain-containing protein|nr:AMMECR1 domain-containing protein [Sulfurimonadaceae bacterium]
MARSVLLQLARDSIAEVIEAKRLINKNALLSEYPLLGEKMATAVNLYVAKELRGSALSAQSDKTLFEDIVYNAKKAAFDSTHPPMTTAEYIDCEVEVVLYTEGGEMREKDPALSHPHRM